MTQEKVDLVNRLMEIEEQLRIYGNTTQITQMELM
jgi:hypothetical protein